MEPEMDDPLIELLRKAAPGTGPDLAARLARRALDELDRERMRVLRGARYASLAASFLAASAFAWIFLSRQPEPMTPPAAGNELAAVELEMQQTLILHERDAQTDEAVLLVDESGSEDLIVGYLADAWREEP